MSNKRQIISWKKITTFKARFSQVKTFKIDLIFTFVLDNSLFLINVIRNIIFVFLNFSTQLLFYLFFSLLSNLQQHWLSDKVCIISFFIFSRVISILSPSLNLNFDHYSYKDFFLLLIMMKK